MVFWKSLPIGYLLKSLIPLSPFHRLDFYPEVDAVAPLPSSLTIQRIKGSHPIEEKETKELCEFLWMYFGNPPHHPRLEIPERFLLGEKDLLLCVREEKKTLVGVVRYHYIGRFLSVAEEPEIYSVDCFCIHPQWRGKKVGDRMLSELQRFANEMGKPFACFLKEGPMVSILHRPMYSGEYAYRRIDKKEKYHSPRIYPLSTLQMERMMKTYRRINPSAWIIWDNTSQRQQWLLYTRNSCYVWVCIQPSDQTIQGQTIGWVTGWLESSELTDEFREEALYTIACSKEHSYDYLWVNKKWTGHSAQWKQDGPFHYYPFQWSSSLSMNSTVSYCMFQ